MYFCQKMMPFCQTITYIFQKTPCGFAKKSHIFAKKSHVYCRKTHAFYFFADKAAFLLKKNPCIFAEKNEHLCQKKSHILAENLVGSTSGSKKGNNFNQLCPRMTLNDSRVTQDDPRVTQDDLQVTQDDFRWPRMTPIIIFFQCAETWLQPPRHNYRYLICISPFRNRPLGKNLPFWKFNFRDKISRFPFDCFSRKFNFSNFLNLLIKCFISQ